MTMRPLNQEERDGMRERLGEDVMRRLDALVVAGYALHAVGVDDPAGDEERWRGLASWLLGPTVDPLARMELHLLDGEGDLWEEPLGQPGMWSPTSSRNPEEALPRELVEKRYGGVREAWVS